MKALRWILLLTGCLSAGCPAGEPSAPSSPPKVQADHSITETTQDRLGGVEEVVVMLEDSPLKTAKMSSVSQSVWVPQL